MEQARTLEAVAEESPLAHARLQRRLRALAAFAAVLAAAAVAVVLGAHGSEPGPSAAAASAATLPAPWTVKVVVLNGGGDIVYTRSVASRVQALSYRVVHV